MLSNRLVRRSLPGNWLMLMVALLGNSLLEAGDFETVPIRYSDSVPNNQISRLQKKLTENETKLEFRSETGYLKDLLQSLSIPESSQVLVYSKTSFQRQKIAPRTPRAIYFNDDCYIGYCQKGDVLEVSVADPDLGTVFYSLEQNPFEAPRFLRQTDSCLICHGGSMTEGIPGHVVRSVYPTPSGEPIYSAGSFRVDHRTPFEKRWGGWYVSGTHGNQKHLGNLIVRTKNVSLPVENPEGMNLTDLSHRFDPHSYLTPHSDLIALMVLEHQAQGHNLVIKAGFETRQALYYESALRKDLKESPSEQHWESTRRRIDSACRSLAKYLLFHEEAPLTEPIQGTSKFAIEFAANGMRDSRGRSLRDFDLKTRLFRYPLSYLIYTEAFQKLPQDALDSVWKEIYSILTSNTAPEYGRHLSVEERIAILEIVRETVKGLPNEWNCPNSETVSQP